ncbi:hypothetical protein QBK93_36905 [Rhizobium leguminosarum]|uniref:hypothetical protein n=1 Tax=Rhizobium leguminosarum TaxID=384 RepID=UPI0024A9D131|nr:hypothetical protein [Rhizobium leguminosarum]MDI5930165.1 hypothetical protein [Rhizobium leguminosarum]
MNSSAAVVSLVVALTLSGQAGAIETAYSTKCNGKVCQPSPYRVYTVEEIDQQETDRHVAEEMDRAATAQGDKELSQQIQAVENILKAQIMEALQKLPETIFSDEVKTKLTDDIVETVAAKNREELEKFKVDLKEEILAAVEAKMNSK